MQAINSPSITSSPSPSPPAHVIANLELMPLKMNVRKKDSLGERQKALAQRLRRAGLF